VSSVRPRLHGVLLTVICVALAAALLAATVGSGVSGLGLRELVSGPGLPSASGLPAAAPATSAAPVGSRRSPASASPTR